MGNMRPAKPLGFDAVRAVGLGLPGVEEGTMYGAPALKVGKKMFACLASHTSAEPNSLVVRMDIDRRDELIAADPAAYYITDHYLHYPSVLVRLDRVGRDALSDVVRMAWRYVSARQSPRPPRSRQRAD
jgi:hypothetical protein